MILRGIVGAQAEARVKLRLRGATGAEIEVHALVDTGYTGRLTLPTRIAIQLGLVPRSDGRILLADGSSAAYIAYGVEVEWLGKYCWVVASAIGDDVVIGMGMLWNHAVMIEVVVGGAVSIQRMEPQT